MKRSLFIVFALLVLSVTSAFGAKNYDNPDTIVVATARASSALSMKRLRYVEHLWTITK